MRMGSRQQTWGLVIATLAICGFLWGYALSTWLGGYLLPTSMYAQETSRLPQSNKKEVNIAAIAERNMFCSFCAPPPSTDVSTKGPVDTTPIHSTLPMVVTSVMWFPEEREFFATIRYVGDEYKNTYIFRRGNPLPVSGTIIDHIEKDRVVFVYNDHLEFLKLGDKAPSVAPTSSATTNSLLANNPLQQEIEQGVKCTIDPKTGKQTSCEIARSLVDKLTSNMAALATSAMFFPRLKNEQPDGLTIRNIRPGSFFAKIGLQNGDVLKTANGSNFDSPEKALEVYGKLKSASNLTMAIERRGELTTLDYQIR